MLKYIWKKSKNHASHTDIKWTCVKDFIECINQRRNKVDIATAQTRNQKTTNLYGVKECWNDSANGSKTSFFYGSRQKSTESLLVRTDFACL